MLFDKIGKTYNDTRAADERIISELIRLLGLYKGAIIADIVDRSVKQLSSDLECGLWEKLYGDVLHIDKIDAGYFFILAK